jgi:hypothetical protein
MLSKVINLSIMPAQFATNLSTEASTQIWGFGFKIGPEEIFLVLISLFILVIAFYLVKALKS